MPKLAPGDPAPDFDLADQHGQNGAAGGLSGAYRKLLLYFYPKADTRVYPAGCSVRDVVELAASKAGGGGDRAPTPAVEQQKFDDKYGLSFPLLADTERRTARAYGAWGEKNLYGRRWRASSGRRF